MGSSIDSADLAAPGVLANDVDHGAPGLAEARSSRCGACTTRRMSPLEAKYFTKVITGGMPQDEVLAALAAGRLVSACEARPEGQGSRAATPTEALLLGQRQDEAADMLREASRQDLSPSAEVLAESEREMRVRVRARQAKLDAAVVRRAGDDPQRVLVLGDVARERHGQVEAETERLVLGIRDAEDRLLRFLPGDDPRVVGTVEAVQRELSVDGFVQRYGPWALIVGASGFRDMRFNNGDLLCIGASMFYAAYLRFMTFDLECWRIHEPNDWNLWRRMWMAGVRFGR